MLPEMPSILLDTLVKSWGVKPGVNSFRETELRLTLVIYISSVELVRRNHIMNDWLENFCFAILILRKSKVKMPAYHL